MTVRRYSSVKELFSKISRSSPYRTCNGVLFLIKLLLNIGLHCRCFPVNITNFLGTAILQCTCWQLVPNHYKKSFFALVLSLDEEFEQIVLMLQNGALLVLKYANQQVLAQVCAQKKIVINQISAYFVMIVKLSSETKHGQQTERTRNYNIVTYLSEADILMSQQLMSRQTLHTNMQ